MLGDEIAIYLAGQGLGLVVGSTGSGGIFSLPFPTEAGDSATCVIEYPGKPPIRAMGPALQAPIFEQARFQLCSRDLSDRGFECRSLQKNMLNALSHLQVNLAGTTGGVVVYGYVESLTPPFFLKYDESGRVVYATNYSALKAVSP